jgi:hypothetical protein
MKFQLDKTHSATIGADLPDHMPAYAKVYPGADVQGVVDLTSAGMGWVVNYTVPARPKDVLDFYKKNSAAEGLETKNDSVIGQAFDFSARKNDAYVSVMIDGKDGGTFVQLKYK